MSTFLSWRATKWSMSAVSSGSDAEADVEIWKQSVQNMTQATTSKNVTTSTSTSTAKVHSKDEFAACLLIKDDNDIFNEWIAYHYHVVNLRHVIVATDPSSKTSPKDLLERWHQPPFGLEFELWQDADYMPEYFLQGKFDLVPSFLPEHMRQNASTSIWHQAGASEETRDGAQLSNLTTEESIEADLVQINNHRFRQATFVSHCFRRLKDKGRSWVAHIDTDEYMIINHRLRQRRGAVKDMGALPSHAYAGSLVEFLHKMFRYYPKRLFRSCVMMPTILFGATEQTGNETWLAQMNQHVPSSWIRLRFETLRWTYHADWREIANGLQKAIVDVSTLPVDHPIFVEERIKSVHQPLDSSYPGPFKQICRRMTLKPEVDSVRLYPLTINHYVGSLERYMAREDKRRNRNIYLQKAGVNASIDDDGWIQSWFHSFLDSHGEEAVRRVLQDYWKSSE
eukprot:Nitzschia sp. Nitz4//scaffold109_size72162//35656//37014//NITZ4_005847-RA/size72162-processed-gene-0.12-mRNA-1//1//CDS//3329532766//9017//frame0